MKKLLFIILSSFFFICYLGAQCTGLQINGYNSDNPDQVRLLATANIPGGTVFFLTDNEWDGTSFNSGESIISWTAPAGGVASGSTILLSGTTATCGTSSGTVLPLSTTDEEIYITSVNPSGTVDVTNICHAVVFGDGTSSSSIAGIPGAIDNGNFDNWDGTTTSDNIVSIPASCTLLPIDILNFGVKNINVATTLYFSTASERNNDYFSIERSNDGASFTEIGRVTGSGTTFEKQDYTYTDASPSKGINYYRLKQVDFDGTFSYSGVVSIMMGRTTTFVVSPSPAADRLKVRFKEATTETGRYEIFDQTGRLVMTGEVPAESVELNLEVNALTTGTYVIRMTSGRETITEQFRKL